MMQVGALAEVRELPLDIETVYRTHSAAVARWAARLAGPDLEAEDLVQEVFLIAQRKLSGFRGEASPARWLYCHSAADNSLVLYLLALYR